MQIARLTLLSLLASLWIQSLHAQGLLEVIMDSEHIIAGYVVRTTEKPIHRPNPEFPDYKEMIATIQVLRVIKGIRALDVYGRPFLDTIEVQFPVGIDGSTYYYKYEDRTYVITCLRSLEENWGAPTSYAQKVDPAIIETYARQIDEVLEVTSIPDKQLQFSRMVDWFVRNANYPSLIYEGNGGEFGGCFSDWFDSYTRGDGLDKIKNALTWEQFQRLKTSLLKRPVDSETWCLARLIYDGDDDLIERHLIGGLLSLPPERYWFAGHYFDLLKHKGDSPEIPRILEEFYNWPDYRRDGHSYYDNEGEMKDLIKKFAELVSD
jgi:hypothetical protein